MMNRKAKEKGRSQQPSLNGDNTMRKKYDKSTKSPRSPTRSHSVVLSNPFEFNAM